MARPIREKACDRSHTLAPVLYRVQLDATRQWQFVCDRCYPTVSTKQPSLHLRRHLESEEAESIAAAAEV